MTENREIDVEAIIKAINSFRIPCNTEKQMQDAVEKAFIKAGLNYVREYRFDSKNIVDFFVDGVAVECKIQGSPTSINAQLLRYASFDETNEILLVTAKHMGVPNELLGKRSLILKTNKTWF